MRRSCASRQASLLAISLLIAGLLAGTTAPAQARGKPSGGGGSGSATLVCPAAAAAGKTFAVTGAGYDPTKAVWILAQTSSTSGWTNLAPDSSGKIAFSWTEWSAGSLKFTSHLSPDTASPTLASCSTSVG